MKVLTDTKGGVGRRLAMFNCVRRQRVRHACGERVPHKSRTGTFNVPVGYGSWEFEIGKSIRSRDADGIREGESLQPLTSGAQRS